MTNSDSERFTVSVDYDDLRWHTIQHKSYSRVNTDLKPEHFPIGGHSVSEVVMEYVTFDDEYEPTAQEVIDEISRRGLRLPDRAETESFLDQNLETENPLLPIIGLCGSVVARGSYSDLAIIDACLGWRSMEFVLLDDCWDVGCCFLAVRPA